MRYWTSDLHFGHKNIIKYCNRPWTDVETMTEGLVAKWNEKIKPEDEVFFLGDLTLGLKPAAMVPIMERLNGKTKHWAYGNHDSRDLRKLLAPFFASQGDILETKENGQHIVMCHYPMLRWNGSSHGSWMLHGHSHGQLTYPFQGKILDVSADGWNWSPITFDEIKAKLEAKPVVFETDRKEM